MRRILLLALMAALFTTACRIEANVLIDLNDDGSGSLGFELGMDEEFRTLIEQDGGEGLEFADPFSGLDTGLPGAVATSRTEGDLTYNGATVAFTNQAELQQVIAAAELGEGGDVTVNWTENAVSISAVIDGIGGGLGLGDLGDAEGDFGGIDLSSDLSGIADNFFSGSVILSMPGDVTNHNADRVMDDGRLVWDLKLDGSNVDITAESSLDSSSDFPIWAIVVFVLIAIAVVAWIISIQRRRDAALAAVSSAGDVAAAPSAPAGWGDGQQSDPDIDEPGSAAPADPGTGTS
jgi:hypothetical protein